MRELREGLPFGESYMFYNKKDCKHKVYSLSSFITLLTRMNRLMY